MPVDLFHSIRSRPQQGLLSEDEWAAVFRGTRSAYHRALAGAALAGCDVIGDHVLSERWRLADLLDLTAGVDVLLVHVTCDVDELAGTVWATRWCKCALREARRRGACSVDLTSRPSREAANRLYQRLGFVQRQSLLYRWAGDTNR